MRDVLLAEVTLKIKKPWHTHAAVDVCGRLLLLCASSSCCCTLVSVSASLPRRPPVRLKILRCQRCPSRDRTPHLDPSDRPQVALATGVRVDPLLLSQKLCPSLRLFLFLPSLITPSARCTSVPLRWRRAIARASAHPRSSPRGSVFPGYLFTYSCAVTGAVGARFLWSLPALAPAVFARLRGAAGPRTRSANGNAVFTVQEETQFREQIN